MYFYCDTPRYNDSFICVKQVQGADILEVISDGLRVQAQTAVELSRLWEEQHHKQKKDTASVKKDLAGLREAHQRLSQQISGLYESFALGEIGKAEYLAAKASAVKQRDNTTARISELEAAGEVSKEVLVYPGNRFEIIWNCREELKNLILDLQ